MGIKGEVEGGFPQPKPAFTALIDWDPKDFHALGPTTHPKNQLSHINFQGGLFKTVQGSGLPYFEAVVVDGVGWTQEEHLLSGEAWVKGEATALLRVIEPSGSSGDPTETGLIRMKWASRGILPRLQDYFKKDRDLEAKIVENPQMPLPQGALGSISFTTGDPRYKFLEHAVYVGRYRFMATPPEGSAEKPRIYGEYKISYVAA